MRFEPDFHKVVFNSINKTKYVFLVNATTHILHRPIICDSNMNFPRKHVVNLHLIVNTHLNPTQFSLACVGCIQ